MFEPNSKKALLGALVACFAVQTGLVYSDEPTGPLSEAAVRGRRILHENACQVCHQFYGQGGFLGPDLTNVARRLDDARLTSLLTVGSGPMPAFALSRAEIDDVRAFLTDMDRPDLGQGQLRLGVPDAGTNAAEAFSAVVGAAAPPAAAAGFAAMEGRICSTCHIPFGRSLVGAPDLSTVVERLDASALRTVLRDGRPALGMPPPAPALAASEMEALADYFAWLNRHREELRAETERRRTSREVAWSRLPWWEFR